MNNVHRTVRTKRKMINRRITRVAQVEQGRKYNSYLDNYVNSTDGTKEEQKSDFAVDQLFWISFLSLQLLRITEWRDFFFSFTFAIEPPPVM